MRTRVLLLSVLICSAPFSAHAQGEVPETAEADEDLRALKAREAYEAGKTHYKVGEFDAAERSFARAYKLRPAPLLLFNMAQCHRQLKNHERAVFFLEGYLRDAKPGDANREVAAELLIEERAELEAAEKAAAEADVAAAAEAEAAAAQAQAAVEVEEVGAAANAAAAGEPSEEPIWTQWWLWTGVAAGVAVVAVAAGATAAAVALSGDGVPDSSLGTVDLRGGS